MDHGRKLTAEEYQQAVVRLYTEFRGSDGKLDVLADDLRKAELNLAIDFRLGVDFPVARRELLWHTQQRIEKRRREGWVSIFFSMMSSAGRRFRSDLLAKYLFREYASVLTPDEMKAFLGD